MAAIFLLVMGIWYFQVVPNTTALDTDYARFSQFRGSDRIAEKFGGELGEERYHIRDSVEKTVSVLDDNTIKINVDITSTHRDTGKVVFRAMDDYLVDRYSKTLVDDPRLHYAFPTNVEKKSYDFFHPIIHRPTTLNFVEVVELGGLEAYKFECAQKTNDNTAAFEQFEGKTIHVNYNCHLSIEPKTGNLLEMELRWHNFFVDDEGKKISDVQIGSASSTEFFTSEQILLAKKDLDRNYLFNTVIPFFIGFFFILVSVILFVVGKIYSDKANRAKEKLELEKSKNEFIQLFSHELKTPLVLVRGYCEILMENEDIAKFKQKSFLKKIYLESEDLLKMIKKMVFIQKLDSIFKIQSKTIFVDEYIKEIQNSFKHIIEHKNADLIIEDVGNMPFRADPALLRHVFDNLINNAIPNLPDKGGEIHLGVNFDNEKIIFNISNNGTKIPEEQLDKIFQKYYQADKSLSSPFSGSSGLGLSICMKIVELHKGKIYAWNDNGQTVFTFWIPK